MRHDLSRFVGVVRAIPFGAGLPVSKMRARTQNDVPHNHDLRAKTTHASPVQCAFQVHSQ